MSRIRNICVTHNNYTAADVAVYKSLTYSYIILSNEYSASGTNHIQGYIEFKNAISFNSLKKKLPKAHFERRNGTSRQAAGYCKKGTEENNNYEQYVDEPGEDFEEIFEAGILSKQGKRNDISRLTDMIADGCTLKEVAKADKPTFVKYHKGFKALQSVLIEPRNCQPEVIVLYGKTGVGKSKQAREIFKDEPYYVWTPQRGKWFDSYEGQTNIIFEEFRGQLPFGMLLSLLDRYECPVEYKGGSIEFVGTKIVITSPLPSKLWYNESEFDNYDKYEQLERRISKEIELF